MQELDGAAAEDRVALADGDQAPHPVEQRARVAPLRLDVDRLVAVDRVDDQRQVERLRVGAREAGVAVAVPLHRRAHAVAVAEVDVVAHADLVAVVEDRRAGQQKSRLLSSSMPPAAVVHQRRQAAADAEVEAHARVARVLVVHVVALVVGHHLERQLVVVAQEDAPLAVVGNRRRLRHDLDDRACASSWRSAMKMRGISGKWNAMWHSSPSPK